jgi:hypothetical protein
MKYVPIKPANRNPKASMRDLTLYAASSLPDTGRFLCGSGPIIRMTTELTASAVKAAGFAAPNGMYFASSRHEAYTAINLNIQPMWLSA